MRGLTAPVFFTVTGFVFVFLLLKENKPLRSHERVRKGVRRAALLLILGYALKWNIGYMLNFRFFPHHFVIDVLHIIGLALLALIGIYALHRTWGTSYALLLGLAGVAVFLLFPVVEAADWTTAPRWLANYFSMAYGSTFTIFPWLGYALLGGVIGSIAHHHTAWFKSWWMPYVILGLGFWLHFNSYTILSNIHQLLGWDLSAQWLDKQYLFWRLGHVLIVLAIFVFLELSLKKGFHPLFLKIGSETLTIYGAHYVILYSTWFGVGLTKWWKQSLNPMQVLIGALLFEAFFVLLIAYIEKVRHILYVTVPALGTYAFRWLRVLIMRSAHRLKLQYPYDLGTPAGYFSTAVYRTLSVLFDLAPKHILRKSGTQG